MKLVALTAAASIAASAAFAGEVAYMAPAEPEVVMEQEDTMGGSGSWLIPLLAIALIALAVSNSNSES